MFEAIVQAGVHLFEGAAVAVSQPVGDQVHLRAIAEDDPARAVVEIVYADVDQVLWGAAELSVRAQLAYLTSR